MEEDNLTRQVDEVEALSSIYGEQWCTMDASSRRYNIEISADNSNTQDTSPVKLSLQVQLPADYPGSSPPQYQLRENLGESIIYLWVEHIRDFVQAKSEDEFPSSQNSKEASAEEGEEDFDPSVLGDACEASHNLEMDEEEQGLECPEIFHGEFVHDRKSVFQGHIAAVHSVKQVQMVMDKLLENRKIAAATHNIQAYRISKEKNGHPILIHGCVDDGEIHAGSRMLHLLQIIDASDVLVVVTRWYGGVHLGPDRFKHINNCTRQMLLAHGYVKEKEDKKKGPKSSKKGK